MLTIALAPQADALAPLPGLPVWLARLLAARGIVSEETAQAAVLVAAEAVMDTAI